MRKSTLFISATLTTFILAILAGVITAYKTFSGTLVGDVQAQAEVAPVSVQTVAVVSQPVTLTPEQAADLASQVMGDNSLFSVEVTQFNNESAYLVTFSSGDLVYISMDGRILSIDKLDVVVVSVPADNNGKDSNGAKPRNDDDHDDDHGDDRDDDHKKGEDRDD